MVSRDRHQSVSRMSPARDRNDLCAGAPTSIRQERAGLCGRAVVRNVWAGRIWMSSRGSSSSGLSSATGGGPGLEARGPRFATDETAVASGGPFLGVARCDSDATSSRTATKSGIRTPVSLTTTLPLTAVIISSSELTQDRRGSSTEEALRRERDELAVGMMSVLPGAGHSKRQLQSRQRLPLDVQPAADRRACPRMMPGAPHPPVTGASLRGRGFVERSICEVRLKPFFDRGIDVVGRRRRAHDFRAGDEVDRLSDARPQPIGVGVAFHPDTHDK
jgi:hypothetical protein